jgi:hypothetical protein
MWILRGNDEVAVQFLQASSTLVRRTPASLKHEDMHGYHACRHESPRFLLQANALCMQEMRPGALSLVGLLCLP